MAPFCSLCTAAFEFSDYFRNHCRKPRLENVCSEILRNHDEICIDGQAHVKLRENVFINDIFSSRKAVLKMSELKFGLVIGISREVRNNSLRLEVWFRTTHVDRRDYLKKRKDI